MAIEWWIKLVSPALSFFRNMETVEGFSLIDLFEEYLEYELEFAVDIVTRIEHLLLVR